MKISLVHAGLFKLDGGAMFGVVPKMLWNRLNPADEDNLCTWAMRCLMIETDDRKILVDTGIGDKQDQKFRSIFQPHGDHTLLSSLRDLDLAPEDITDVFITHFHFDHVGGAVRKDDAGNLVPAFPKATYWTSESHYRWAARPNPREQASFLKENFVPLRDAGVLRMIEERSGTGWLEGIEVLFFNGHTEAMMVPVIPFRGRKIVFAADLLPSSYHIRIPYVMSYDVRPLVTMEEKSDFLSRAVDESLIICFEHDPKLALATITRDDRDRYVIGERLSMVDLNAL